MTRRNWSEHKVGKITYWIATVWLALGMGATGFQQLFHMQLEGATAPPGVYGIIELGYPVYVLTIIGIWKILGVITILIPRFPLMKEWAYAGFFFLLSGALFSHVAAGHLPSDLFPAALLILLTALSWYLRPASRSLATTSQTS